MQSWMSRIQEKIDSETPKLDSEKKRSVIPKTDLPNNQSTLMTYFNQEIFPLNNIARPVSPHVPTKFQVISLRKWSNLFWVVRKNSLANHPANQESSLKRIWYPKYRSLAILCWGRGALKDGNSRRIWFGWGYVLFWWKWQKYKVKLSLCANLFC